MPLLDHFQPPLPQRRHWESFLAAWAEGMAADLNQSLLAILYAAETCVSLSENGRFDSQEPDLIEVQILSEEEGSRLVAAIELVSPANKDRPANRRMFAVKCASYLQSGVSVIIVDVVMQRSGNLFAELLDLLGVDISTPGQGLHDLYATAHRTARRFESELGNLGLPLDVW